MNQTTRILLLALSFLSAGGASAAIFDTMDSVDTLKVIAAQKTEKTDRMPAGNVSDPTKDEESGNAKVPDDEKEK